MGQVQENIRWMRTDPVKRKLEEKRTNEGQLCLANNASPGLRFIKNFFETYFIWKKYFLPSTTWSWTYSGWVLEGEHTYLPDSVLDIDIHSRIQF